MNKPLIGSYSMLNTFKNVCEHQFYRRYIKKDQPFVETEAMRWGNKVHKAFEERIGKGIVLPDDMLQWEHYATPFDHYDVYTELQLGINSQGAPVDYWADDVWFRGKLDAAVIVHDKALLTDWKTGSSRFEDSFQLKTNAFLLKRAFPALRTIVGRYVYLKENKLGTMYTLDDFGMTWATILLLMTEIEKKKKSGEWTKKKSGLCGYCSVKDCENYFVAKP